MRMRMAGAALAAALLLAGCSVPTAEPPAALPSATPSGSPAVPESVRSLTPAPSDAEPDDGVQPGRHEAPEWDEASRQAVVDAAVTAMTAFARPGLAFDAWWEDIEPLLTPEAARDYAYVDPVNIPAAAVTGPAVIVDDTSAYLAHVEVPTDVGAYTLILSREDARAPWLVSRFTPPEEAS